MDQEGEGDTALVTSPHASLPIKHSLEVLMGEGPSELGDLGGTEGTPCTRLASRSAGFGPSHREQAVEMGNPAWPLVSSRSGFVNPGATYILDQMVDVGGSVLCTVFTSIPASTHYIAIAFPKLTIKMSPDIAQFPQGEERVQDHSKPLLWTNPCPKGPEAL